MGYKSPSYMPERWCHNFWATLYISVSYQPGLRKFCPKPILQKIKLIGQLTNKLIMNCPVHSEVSVRVNISLGSYLLQLVTGPGVDFLPLRFIIYGVELTKCKMHCALGKFRENAAASQRQ